MSDEQPRGRVDERAIARVMEAMRRGVKEIILKRSREDAYRVLIVSDVTGDEPPPSAVR